MKRREGLSHESHGLLFQIFLDFGPRVFAVDNTSKIDSATTARQFFHA